ncbi:MAG: hypothetical protein Q9157_004461 [Trypethelium eluteriae]
MGHQETPDGLVPQHKEFTLLDFRQSLISISEFPQPPSSTRSTSPVEAPHVAGPKSAEEQQTRTRKPSARINCSGDSNDSKGTPDHTATSFLPDNDIVEGQQSFDSDSDVTVPTDILGSENDSISFLDSSPATSSTCTDATALSPNPESPWTSMRRTYKPHHESLHINTSSPATSTASVTLPHHHLQSPPRHREFDINVHIPSPGLSFEDLPNARTSIVSSTATVTASGVPASPVRSPPSPLLPPLPSRPPLRRLAGENNMYGLGGKNALAYYSPSQARAHELSDNRVKTVAYDDVTSKIPPRTQDIWKDQDGDKDELFLPPPMPLKSPTKPAIPPRSPKRATVHRRVPAVASFAEDCTSARNKLKGSNVAESVGDSEYDWVKVPGPLNGVDSLSPRPGSMLLDLIAELRTENNDDDTGDEAPATPTPILEAKPRVSTEHEDSGVAFMIDPDVQGDSTEASTHDSGSIAAAVEDGASIARSTMAGKLQAEEAEVEASTQRSHSLIASLRRRATELAAKQQRFASTVQTIRQHIASCTPAGATSQMQKVRLLLRQSKLREAELMVQELEMQKALTECVIELLEVRNMIGLGEKGHKEAICDGCVAAERFERSKKGDMMNGEKDQVRRSVLEMLVSEDADGGVLGCTRDRNDGKWEDRTDDKLECESKDATKAVLEKAEKDGKHTDEAWKETGKSPHHTEDDAAIAKEYSETIRRKSVGQSHTPATSTYAVVLDTSPTMDASTQDAKKFVEDLNPEKIEGDDIGDDPEWMSRGIYRNVDQDATTAIDVPHSQAVLKQDRKVAELEQLRRTNPAVYSFLGKAPKRSISPTRLATKGPLRPIPSLRQDGPLPEELPRVRAAHESDRTDHRGPKVIDERELPAKFHLRKLMQRRKGGGSTSSDGASPIGTGLRREDGVIFRSPTKTSKAEPERSSPAKEPANDGTNQKHINNMKKVTEAKEYERSSEDTSRSSGDKVQRMPSRAEQFIR